MRLARHSILIVNAVGMLISGGLALGGIWQVFLQPGTVSAELRDLRTTLRDKTRDLASLEYELGHQESLLEQQESKLIADGTPLGQNPLEQNLQAIIELARRNNFHLMDMNPSGSAMYPGVREVRHHIRGDGKYAAVTRMLRQFESCDFWGDITHIRIERPRNLSGLENETREMEMTVSFYTTVDLAREPAGAR
ncbi:MAG: hypothetical protein KAV82_07120 [Phycisphaerae bacterium]|nr:hypothetical protein [Phycisphaerae bacterium]